MEEEEEEKQPQQEVELENEPSEAPLPTCQPSTSSVMDDPTAAGIKVPFNQFLFLDAFFKAVIQTMVTSATGDSADT